MKEQTKRIFLKGLLVLIWTAAIGMVLFIWSILGG